MVQASRLARRTRTHLRTSIPVSTTAARVPATAARNERDIAPPPPFRCWNSRVVPSAVQEKIWPIGLLLPIQPPPGQAQERIAPVVRVTTWMDWPRSRASLVPSGDTVIPASWAEGIVSGTGSRASVAVWVAGSKVILKNAMGVVMSRFWAGIPAWPEAIGQYRWAARTKVRSSLAALTHLKIW